MYTGIEGGDLLSYDLSQGPEGTWQFLTRIMPAENCRRLSDEEKCGRIGGIVADQHGR